MAVHADRAELSEGGRHEPFELVKLPGAVPRGRSAELEAGMEPCADPEPFELPEMAVRIYGAVRDALGIVAELVELVELPGGGDPRGAGGRHDRTGGAGRSCPEGGRPRSRSSCRSCRTGPAELSEGGGIPGRIRFVCGEVPTAWGGT